jgi:hypothetical protein
MNWRGEYILTFPWPEFGSGIIRISPLFAKRRLGETIGPTARRSPNFGTLSQLRVMIMFVFPIAGCSNIPS